MSRLRKLSQTLWHCQYHIVWCPKYRFRVFEGETKEETEACIKTLLEVQKCELLELNVQIDHVHLLVIITPKISVSSYVGAVKGRTAIRVFSKFRKLWGNHLFFLPELSGVVNLTASTARADSDTEKRDHDHASEDGSYQDEHLDIKVTRATPAKDGKHDTPTPQLAPGRWPSLPAST